MVSGIPLSNPCRPGRRRIQSRDARGSRDSSEHNMKISIPLKVAVGVALVASQAAVADDQLEEVVVTAQKRSERLQDVPIQVDVFTAQNVADAGIHDTSDFVGYVPNMTFDRADTYRNSFVVVRGLAQVTNADPPIAVIVDGVPQVDQKQFNMRLFDLDQIEVLKGPQGTLYGRDAIGGAVIINTRAPTDHLAGYGEMTVGNGSSVNTTAGISGPLIPDRLLFRVSADYLHSGGLIDNSYLGDKSDFVHYDYTTRGRLTLIASDAWTVDVRGSFGRFSGASNEYSWVKSESANDFVTPTYGFYPNAHGDSTDAVVKVDGDLGFAQLTWINGYNRITEVDRADLDFSNPVQDPGGFLNLGIQVGQGQDLNDAIYSEELRLTSKSKGPLRWVGGAVLPVLQQVAADTRVRGSGWQPESDRQPGVTDRQSVRAEPLPVDGVLRAGRLRFAADVDLDRRTSIRPRRAGTT